MAIMLGSDMVLGMDILSASEGNGKNIVGPIGMLNHHPQFLTLGAGCH